MSGKKTPPEQQALTDSPFKKLKGLSVSGKTSPAAEESLPPERSDQPGSDDDAGTSHDDAELFRREMQWLGVRPGAREAGKSEPGDPPVVAGAGDANESDSDDEQLFAAAVGRMDKTFPDADNEIPEHHARPRRSRQLKRGRIRPEAELDLHGLSRDAAITRVGYFLDNSRHHGLHCVLIITGKGARSAGEAILRRTVTGLLSADVDRVLEWMDAPRHLGGSGALVVFLRAKSPRT